MPWRKEIFSSLLKPEPIHWRPTVIPAVTSNWTAGMRAPPCQIHRLRLWVQLSQQMKTEGKLTMKIFKTKKKKLNKIMQAARCTPSRVCIIFLNCLVLMSRCVKSYILWAQACWCRWFGWGWISPCGYHCSTSSKILLTRGSELSKLGKCHTRGWRNGWRAIGETLHKPAGIWVCLVTSYWKIDGSLKVWVRSRQSRGLLASSLLIKTLLHENCYSSFSAFPYESLLCSLMWLLQLMWTKWLM